MPRPTQEMQDKLSEAREVPSSRRRGKVAWGGSTEKKMLINHERSRNVYENKQNYDTFTEEKGDISTQRNDILCKRTRILLKSSFFLSLLERWGTNLSLQNVETRCPS